MKKTSLLMVVLLITLQLCLCLPVSAEAVGGECGADGSNVTWSFDIATGILSISGEGEMTSYPWLDSYSNMIYEVVIEDGVTSIREMAFGGCSNLTSIKIPSSVTSIGDGAFMSCNLTCIEIPSSITSIGKMVFSSSSNLMSITVEAGNEVYHSDGNCLIETNSKTLVAGCNNSIIPKDESVTSIGEYAFYFCESLTSIEIPSSITNIGNRAFMGCSNLTNIEIPSSVTSIDTEVFSYCNGLTSIIVEAENKVYHSDGNCLIKTNSKTLVAGCNNSIIPNDESVTSIGDGGFSGCSNLTSIEIPSSVTSIGIGGFYGCSSLTSIKIPSNITSINSSAFMGCSSLTTIKIPSSVVRIDDYAFYFCSRLTCIIYCGTEAQWNDIVKGSNWDNWTGEYKIIYHITHEWDDGKITQIPTCVDGIKTFTCTVCEETKTESIDKISDHVYGEWKEFDEKFHKKECACGDIQHTDHIYDDETDNTCNDCGYVRVIDEISEGVPTEENNQQAGCGSTVSAGLIFLLTISGTGALVKKKED